MAVESNYNKRRFEHSNRANNIVKLVKFRIKNYKSIVDSGDCYFSDKLTILAGKNESGKTSILEALEDFHENNTIRESAVPIEGESIPVITVTFDVSANDVNKALSDALLDTKVNENMRVTLEKTYDTKSYTLDNDSLAKLNLGSLFAPAYNKARDLKLSVPKPRWTTQTLSAYAAELENLKSTITNTDDIESINQVITSVKEHNTRYSQMRKFVDTFVKNKLPYFILFSSFDDRFPDEIPLTELDTSEWAIDLEQVSSFSRKTIAATNKQKQANHQSTVNAEFTNKFKEYWTQDTIRLQVQKNETINFWIEEDGILHTPSQRSQGQQWYLSFYIKIVARISENKPNVILIDEPGLFLHARAQKDLLNVLNNHTSSYPVLFSTHSPYLITEDNLENVRLVEKRDRKTTILGKIHAHESADKETLTPILTAIGLGVNDSITNIDLRDNVVVEGPEDVFYLQAFRCLLPEAARPKANFINGGGAGNMGTVGAILEGWGARVWYLFDNDQGMKDGAKALSGIWKVLPDSIKKVVGDTDSAITDIFSVSDFKKYVLDNEAAKYTVKNSAYIKKNKIEKVLLARHFLQKAKQGSVKLSAETTKNITALFEEIKFS